MRSSILTQTENFCFGNFTPKTSVPVFCTRRPFDFFFQCVPANYSSKIFTDELLIYEHCSFSSLSFLCCLLILKSDGSTRESGSKTSKEVTAELLTP